MKTNILFIVICIFLFSNTNIHSKDKYIEKEIFFSKWGNAPGEMPLYVKGAKAINFNLNKISYSGPKLFKVDNFGNFYIMLIGYESQIIKFDKKGNFIVTFQYGFDAFSFAPDENENVFVVAKTENGIQTADFKIFDESGIFLEESKITWPSKDKNDIFYYDNSIYDLSGNIIYKYGTTKIVNTEYREKSKLLIHKIEVSIGNYSEIEETNPIIVSGLKHLGGKIDKKDIFMNEIKGFVIKDFKIVSVTNNNIIFGVIKITNSKKPGPKIFVIIIINNDGNVLTGIYAKKYEILEPGNYIDNFIDVDLEGNIYQMWSSKDGVHITKWEKDKGFFFD